MQKLLLALFFNLTVLHQSRAQNVHNICPADSIRLQKYTDSISASSIYSLKYQHYYDSALAICPWKASWWQQKAMPLYKRQKYELGAPYLDSAVKYDAHHYLDYRAFMKCIFQKDYKGAIKDFEAAQQLVGAGVVMDHTYDFYIGLCQLQLYNLDTAQYYISKSIADQKQAHGSTWVHFLDWFYLGIVYYEQEDYPNAIMAFDQSLAGYKNFSDAKYYKAMCLWKTNKNELALTIMKDAELDFKQGSTINEDNALYEKYPYQVDKPVYYTSSIEYLEKITH